MGGGGLLLFGGFRVILQAGVFGRLFRFVLQAFFNLLLLSGLIVF